MDSENSYNKTDNVDNVDNQRDNLRQEPSVNQNESHKKTDNVDNVDKVDNQRDNLRQEPSINQNESHNNPDSKNLDSNSNTNNEERAPTKGIAGVMDSNFGADHTTTSTFEKSQGEKYGDGFDETGAQLKGRFSVAEPSANEPSADASGSGAGASGSDKHASQNKGHETDTHKEGFAHKLKNKAEGMFHGHHDDKAESRTEAH